MFDIDTVSTTEIDTSSLRPSSVRRIYDNAKAMFNALIDPDTLAPDEITAFIPYLIGNVSLIEVITDSYQAAHRIF